MSGSREIHELAALVTTNMRGFVQQMDRGVSAVERFALAWIRTADKINKAVSDIDRAVTRVATAVATATATVATGVAKTGLDFLALQQRAQIAFTTILKDGDKARKMIADLTRFSLETPFPLEDLIQFSQRLLAMGVSAERVIPTLRAIGDATAALGGSTDIFNRVARAVGQITAKGTFQAEEMRQLAEAGIPAWELLAEVLEVDVPTAMKMVERRTVLTRDVMDDFLGRIESRFGGTMKLSSNAWDGLWKRMATTVKQVSATIVTPLFYAIQEGLVRINAFLQQDAAFADWVQRMRVAVAGLVFEMQRWLSLNAGPILQALGEYFLWAADAAARFVRMLNENSAAIQKHASFWLSLIRTIGKFLAQHSELVMAFAVFKAGSILGVNAAIGSIATAVGGLILELKNLKAGAEGAEMALLKLKMVGFAAATAGIVFLATQIYQANPDIQHLQEEMQRALDLDAELQKIMDKRQTRTLADIQSLVAESRVKRLQEEISKAEGELPGVTSDRESKQNALNERIKKVRSGGNDPSKGGWEKWYTQVREDSGLADASEWMDQRGIEVLRGGSEGVTIRAELQSAIDRENAHKERLAELNAELTAAQAEVAKRQEEAAAQLAKATGDAAGGTGGPGTPAIPVRSDRIDELLAQQQQQAIDDRAPGYGDTRDFLGLEGVTGDDALRFGLNVPGATPAMANQLASDVDAAGGDPAALDAAALRFAMAINQAKAAMEAHTAAVEQSAERQQQAREAIEAGSQQMTDASTRLRDMFGGMSGLTPIITSMNSRFTELASQLQSGSINVDQFNREVSETAQAANAAAEAERRRKILAGDFAGAGFSVQQGLEDRMIRYREQQFQQGLDAMFNQMMGLGGAVQPVVNGFQQLYGGMQQFGQSLAHMGGQVAGGVEQAFGMLSSMMNSKEGAIANLMNQIAMLEQNLQMVDNPFSQQRIMNDIAAFQMELNDLLREAPPVLTESPSGPIDPALQGSMTQSFSISLPNVNKFTSSDASILYDAIEREAQRRGRNLG